MWLTLCLLAPPAVADSAPGDSAYRTDIERLLAITGTEKAGSVMASATADFMLEKLRESRPDMPEQAFDVAREVLLDEFAKAYAAPDGLSARLAEIYARHFTHEEVKGLLTFYGSALGRKTIELMPLLMQESAAAGQEWMRAQMPHIGAAVDRRLRAKGFLK
jgi:hypothetical protein